MDEKNLKGYFADLNTLIHNVLNFHWNVTGGLFLTLHELYQKQYEEIFLSIDHLAELMKGRDIYPLTNLDEIDDFANINTMASKDYSARETIEYEIDQFKYMMKSARELGNLANNEGDLALTDFFTDQEAFFGKQLYFLQQFLK